MFPPTRRGWALVFPRLWISNVRKKPQQTYPYSPKTLFIKFMKAVHWLEKDIP